MSDVLKTHGQRDHGDGRVVFEDYEGIRESAYSNEDLNPVPFDQRTWHTRNYTALWVGMSFCIPSWLLASGLITQGMSWKQAVFIILLANLIVLVPILLNGHGGTKYGIPFPVLARTSWGVKGANFPAIIRALIATAWFGIQTWIGGGAIFFLAGRVFGGDDSWWHTAGQIGGYAWTQWLSFFLFWIFEIIIIIRGIEGLRRFQAWAAPLVAIAAIGLTIYMWARAGSLGDILSKPGLESGAFWKAFGPALMGMIAFWATLSLNIADFTRFGGSQRQQMIGQSAGLPTAMTVFALLSVISTAASQTEFGEAIWDPVQLVAAIDNWAATLFALIVVMLATLSVNIAANLVSPSYDFANAAPKLIDFKRGAIITCVLGVLIMPWNLVENPDVYIFAWLGTYGAILGPVAGIMVADYWIVRKKHIVMRDLFRVDGLYGYSGGFNWRAFVAFLVAAVLAAGGTYSAVGADGKKTGPFPEDGVIGFLKPLYDYGWAVGFVVAAILYALLMKASKVPTAYTDEQERAHTDSLTRTSTTAE